MAEIGLRWARKLAIVSILQPKRCCALPCFDSIAKTMFSFVAHQAVCNGRSLDLFYRELEALYANGSAAEAASLAELPLQYGEPALWRRRAYNG